MGRSLNGPRHSPLKYDLGERLAMAALSIWTASAHGDIERVTQLLKQRGIDPSCKDEAGYTALHYASRQNRVECVRLLIRSGADVDARTPGGGTALMRAAWAGHIEIVRILVSAGADMTLRDSDGQSALDKAFINGHHEVIDLLTGASCVNLECSRNLTSESKSDVVRFDDGGDAGPHDTTSDVDQ